MIFGGAFDAKNCRKAFEEQKRKLIEQGFVSKNAFDVSEGLEACLVTRPKIGKGIFTGKNGAFLIGEAAGFISPSSFEGISYALYSGEILAEAFNRNFDKKRSGVLADYRRKATKLKAKIYLRCLKRPFMYGRVLRSMVMKSGLTAIKIKNSPK